MAILDELKTKASGKADSANNIQEAISMMDLGGSGGAGDSDLFVLHYDNTDYTATIVETPEEFRAAFAAHKAIALDYIAYDGLVLRYQLVNVVDKDSGWTPNPGTPVESLKFIFQKFVASSYDTSGMMPKAKMLSATVINITCPLEGSVVLDGPYEYSIVNA